MSHVFGYIELDNVILASPLLLRRWEFTDPNTRRLVKGGGGDCNILWPTKVVILKKKNGTKIHNPPVYPLHTWRYQQIIVSFIKEVQAMTSTRGQPVMIWGGGGGNREKKNFSMKK